MSNLRLKLTLDFIDKLTSPSRGMAERFNASVKKMQEATKKLSDQLNKMGDKMTGIGKKMSLYVSTPIMGLGVLSVKTAGDVDTLALSLSGMAGGLKNARNLLNELAPYADRSGQSLESVANAAGMLMAAGYKGNNLTEQIRRLTTVAAGSKIELEQLAEEVGKVRANGKLEKGQIELFQKGQIPIIETLADVLGKTRAQVVKLAEEGKITAKDMERAFGQMTSEGGVYFKTLEDQVQSIPGLMKSFRFNVSRILDGLGSDIVKEFDIAGKIKMLTDAVRWMADVFLKLPAPVKSGIIYFGLFLALMGPLLIGIGQITIGIAGTMFVFAKLAPVLVGATMAIKMLGLALLTTPVGWFIMAVTTIAGAAYLVIKNWTKVKAFFSDIWTSIKQAFANGVAAVMNYLAPLINAIKMVREGFGKVGTMMTNNPVTRFVRNNVSSEPPPTSFSSASPVAAAVAPAQRVDAGGTLRIKIDSEGQARVTESRPNDRRMDYKSDTGLLMGAM